MILGRLPAKYRFGVTATPDQGGRARSVVELKLGKIVYRLEARALVRAGTSSPLGIELVRTGSHPSAEDEDFIELVNQLTRMPIGIASCSPSRSVRRRPDTPCSFCRGGSTMPRRSRARQSAWAFAQASLTGQTAKKIRTDVLARFKAGSLDVLCATTIADEGLDVPRLSRLVLATPAKALGRTMQRLGRLMRAHEGKPQPVLFDLVDDRPIAERQLQDRLRAYRTVLGAEAVPSTESET